MNKRQKDFEEEIEQEARHVMGIIVWIAIALACAFSGVLGWIVIDRLGGG